VRYLLGVLHICKMSSQSETVSGNPKIFIEKDSVSGLEKIKISGPKGSSAEAVFKPPKPIRGGIAICFPQ
ncbi:hypothetical protein KI387_024559, partial [Taxus chinensis]